MVLGLQALLLSGCAKNVRPQGPGPGHAAHTRGPPLLSSLGTAPGSGFLEGKGSTWRWRGRFAHSIEGRLEMLGPTLGLGTLSPWWRCAGGPLTTAPMLQAPARMTRRTSAACPGARWWPPAPTCLATGR